MPPRVAVVGAGALGLMMMKNLKEEGFHVTGYESRGFVGGLWKYSEDSALSVTETTIFNSSRYRSAITDFPFPEDTDDFPNAEQMHQYLESYCDHFDLRSCIHLNTRVTGLTRHGEQWALEVSPKGSPSRIDYFDKLAIAVGSFVTPKNPTLDGIDLFQGEALHAIDFHQPSRFKGQNVLMIGLHATAQDVAVSLSEHAAKVYISHKTGLIMLPRYSPDGSTFDQSQSLSFIFFQTFMSALFPTLFNWLIDKRVLSTSKKAYPNIPAKWRFDPAPSVSVTTPLIADEIYPLLANGFAEPISGVRHVTGPKSVELTDGHVLHDIDTIIYCTGYDFSVPFLPPQFNPYPIVGEPPNLYRNIFPLNPDPAIRNSLAFLGHAAITFPGFAQHELVSMAVCQIWLGNSSLPPFSQMQKWRRDFLSWRQKLVERQKFKSTFHVGFVPMADHLKWLDETAGTGVFQHFGWFRQRSWAFWCRDRELYKKCLGGLFSPAIWRLFDMGKRKAWGKAKEQIIEDNERAARQVRERRRMIELKMKN